MKRAIELLLELATGIMTIGLVAAVLYLPQISENTSSACQAYALQRYRTVYKTNEITTGNYLVLMFNGSEYEKVNGSFTCDYHYWINKL